MKNPFHYFIIVYKPNEYYDIKVKSFKGKSGKSTETTRFNAGSKGAISLKFESSGEEKITVSLSDSDMNNLDITYDELDYSNIETRRVIWTILDEARRKLGKAVDTEGRLLIEVAPGDCGGCVIRFTTLPQTDSNHKKRLVMKKEAEPLIFCGIDENALLDAIDMLRTMKGEFSACNVYSYKNKFYIVIKPLLTLSEHFIHKLSEYGNITECKKNSICRLYEQGKLLLNLAQ